MSTGQSPPKFPGGLLVNSQRFPAGFAFDKPCPFLHATETERKSKRRRNPYILNLRWGERTREPDLGYQKRGQRLVSSLAPPNNGNGAHGGVAQRGVPTDEKDSLSLVNYGPPVAGVSGVSTFFSCSLPNASCSGGTVARPGSVVTGAGGFWTTIFRSSSAAGKSPKPLKPKYSRNNKVVP